VKRHYNDHSDFDKKQRQMRRSQMRGGGFTCSHCRIWVVINEFMGTANRNHCNICLWSKHVDIKKGDRQSHCRAGMKPVALTLKRESLYRTGELMLVHCCANCKKLSINRIAADDLDDSIIAVFTASLKESGKWQTIFRSEGIAPLTGKDRIELDTQLFGKAF
jgi:hypothetical protein